MNQPTSNSKPPWKKEMIWPGLICVIAFGLRLLGLESLSFSNDELSALYRTDVDGFSALIREGVLPDFHPAGIQVFLYYWTSLVGTQEFWVRLPFAIMGSLSVCLIYLIGKRWFGMLPGLTAATLLAVLEFPLLYSVIARPYASGLFFILLVAWCWTKFVLDGESMERKNRLFLMVAFGLSLAACMYDHYFCFLTAAVIGLSGLWKVGRKSFVTYAGAGLIAVGLFLPHLSVSLAHFSIGGLSSWLGKPDLAWPLKHGLYIFNGSLIWSLLALFGGLIAMYRAWNKSNKPLSPWLSLAWWLIPLIIGWTYSVWINPVLQHSILLFGFPFLLLFISSSLKGINSNHRSWIIPLLLILGVAQLVLGSKFYQRQHFADFRDSGRFVNKVLENQDMEQPAWAANLNNRWYLDHYLGENAERLDFLSTDIRDMEGLKRFLDGLDSMAPSSLIYLSLKPEPTELLYALVDRFPGIKVFKDHDGCSWYAWFDQDGLSSTSLLPKPDTTLGITPEAWLPYPCPDTLMNDSQEAFSFLSGGSEFGPSLFIKLDDVPKVKWLHASVRFCYFDIEGDPQLVCSLEDKAGNNVLWRSSAFQVFASPDQRGQVHLFYDLSGISQRGLTLKLYVWNFGLKPVFIDEISANLGY